MGATDYRDSPTYWFAILEIARACGNFLDAQQALDELRRLGVFVQFGRPNPSRPKKGGPHAA
jgi:hypothetical protein